MQPELRITVVLFCFVFSSRYPETDTDSESADVQGKWKPLPGGRDSGSLLGGGGS